LLYADDLKLYRHVENEEQEEFLQRDLNGSMEWSEENSFPLRRKILETYNIIKVRSYSL
jgi:hypothetical protein